MWSDYAPTDNGQMMDFADLPEDVQDQLYEQMKLLPEVVNRGKPAWQQMMQCDMCKIDATLVQLGDRLLYYIMLHRKTDDDSFHCPVCHHPIPIPLQFSECFIFRNPLYENDHTQAPLVRMQSHIWTCPSEGCHMSLTMKEARKAEIPFIENP